MLNNDLIVAIEAGKANRSNVEQYLVSLENYMSDGTNIVHPKYYSAKRHKQLCMDYLATDLDEPIETPTYSQPSSRYLHKTLNIPYEEIEKRLKTIAEDTYTESQLEGIILLLSRDAGCTTHEIRQVYTAIKLQEDREEFIASTKKEVDDIIRLSRRIIDIQDFVPKVLADEIISFSNCLKVRPESCLTALLPAFSTLLKIGTVIEIRPAQGFVEIPYLFAMLVAESGSMKTPIFNVFAKKPLDSIQQSVESNYAAAKALHEEELSEYDSMDDETRSLNFPNGKPQMVDRPKFIHVANKTPEGINAQFSRYPEQAIIYLVDELSGLFGSMDKYTKGQGSERQEMMSMYNGIGSPTVRAKEGLISNPAKVGLSIFGTIQPDVLENFWGEVTDPDGQWSRFLYCYQPKSLKTLPIEQGGADSRLPDLLEIIFKAAYALPAVNYQLDAYGYSVYRAFYEHIAEKGYEEVHPALAKAYSKALGQAGRLILNLHVLNSVIDNPNSQPSQIIPVEIIRKGINLMDYYLEQRELLTKRFSSFETISPNWVSVLELSKKLGWISARDVKRNTWRLKDTDTTEIRKWFQDMASEGYGEIQGRGKHLKFYTGEVNPRQN